MEINYPPSSETKKSHDYMANQVIPGYFTHASLWLGTLKQLKKSYDFNFNIESSDMVNCTELIYLAFDFINWKTHYYMGRYTIYPDDILTTALNDSQRFKIVALLENNTISENPDSSYMQNLYNNKDRD